MRGIIFGLIFTAIIAALVAALIVGVIEFTTHSGLVAQFSYSEIAMFSVVLVVAIMFIIIGFNDEI